MAHNAFEELQEKLVKKYILTVHSTRGRKPVEVLFGRRISSDPEHFENLRNETLEIAGVPDKRSCLQ